MLLIQQSVNRIQWALMKFYPGENPRFPEFPATMAVTEKPWNRSRRQERRPPKA